MRYRLMLVVLGVVGALVVPVGAAGGAGPATGAALQEPAAEAGEDESPIGVEDPEPPLKSTASEEEPSPVRIAREDRDELRVAVPAESIRMVLPTGEHRATPVPGDRVDVADLPLAVVTDVDAFERGAPVPDVRVGVAADQPAEVPGALSPLFEVDFVDETDRAVTPVKPATLEVDVSWLPGGLYGNLRDRLVLKWFDGCRREQVLVDAGTVDEELVAQTVCDRIVEIPTERDVERGVLIASLDPVLRGADGGEIAAAASVDGIPLGGLLAYAGSSSGYGLGSSYSSEQGSWGATPLANTASYQVGLFTGSFETSYPFAVPPAAAGPAPSVGLAYSSGSIDGMATDTNNQASATGLGWSLAAGGSITRHYTTGCEGYENTAPGEFCPLGHEYTLSLNGTGSRLVLEDETTSGNYVATFRLEADPLWRIQLFNEDSASSFANEDAHDEYWVVTTPDGTQYEFGKSTDSVDYAPVYTNGQTQSEFDCEGYESEDHTDEWKTSGGVTLSHTCQKAWRWNLSSIVDVHGNTVTYSYTQETNWYGLRNGNDEAEYVNASHLREVLYTDNGTGLNPQARVLFHTEIRCDDPLSTTDCDEDTEFVDTPIDLVCRDDEACDVTTYPAPAFFSERRLDAVETQIQVGSDWDTVQWWTLDQLFADGTDETVDTADSEPKLWLDEITNRPDLTTDDDGRVGFVQIEVEDFDAKSGSMGKKPASDYGSGKFLNSFGGTDWVRFNDVDFGDGADAILIRYAKADTGGVIRFRTGSQTGPIFASKWPSSTGGWQEWETTSKTITSSPTGIHDVYITVDNSSEVAHLNWIRLVPDTGTLEGLPPTDYGLIHLQNRAEDEDAIANRGASPMRMPRIDQIDLPLGGRVNVTYGTPHGWDTDPTSGPCHQDDLYGEDERLPCHFYGTRYQGVIVRYAKYVVTEIQTVDADVENKSTWTRYDYSRPAWRYSNIPGHNNFTTSGTCSEEPCNRWSDFRGHEWVKVTMHDDLGSDYATTEHRFYQGMDDDYRYQYGTWSYSATIDILDPTDGTVDHTEDDHRWLVGRSSQVITYDGSYSNVLSNTETTYTTYTTTDAVGLHQGRYVATDIVETDTFGTATLSTKVDNNYEAIGSTSPHTDRIVRLTKQSHHGDVDDTADDRMTVYTNTTANTTDWIIALPATVKVRDGLLGSSTLLSEVNYYYDTYTGSNDLGTVGSDGLLTKTETKLNSTEDAVTLYDYDSYGRIEEVTDGDDDHVVHTDYNGTYGYVTKVINAGDAIGTGDHETEIVDYDPGFGLPIKLDDPNNNRITAEYDAYGRLTDVWLPTESTSGEPTIKYEYTIDPTDYPAFVKTSQLTDADGSGTYLESWTFYDGFGGVAQTQEPSASDGKHWIISTGYTDKQGVLRRQAAPFELVLGTAVSGDPDYFDAVWSGGSMNIPLHTVSTYDDFGRLTITESIADDSSPSVLWSSSVAYDIVTITGNLQGVEQTFTDEEDAVIEQVTDANGNLVRVFEYDNTTKITTQYVYDGLNRLVEVTDTDANETTINYDYGGRKTQLIDPDMGTWNYTYDLYGNLATQEDNRDQKLVFEYDEYDRLIAKYDTSINPSNLLAEWDYDANGELGLLDKSVAYESVGGTDYTITVDPQGYDARGRVTSTEWNIDGDTYTIAWTYDRADRIDTITYPTVDGENEMATYSYDGDNRGLPDSLTWLEDYEDNPATAEDLVTAATWDPLGRPLTQAWGSGTYEFDRIWTYESDTQRLDKIQAGDNANTNDIVNLAYQYYDDGNIKYVTDFRNSSQKQCFEYDDLKRLTTAYTLSSTCSSHSNWDDTVGSGPYRRLYQYEDNGNIDKVAGDDAIYHGYTYAGTGNAGPHAVTAYQNWTYTYDANGNLNTRAKTGQPTEDATFNANNQLESYDVGSDTTEFVYDADGTRVIRIDDPNVGSTVTTHYIGGIFEVTDPGATPDETRSYYTFSGTTIGYRLWTSASDDRKFLVADHLGSNAAQVDEASGTVTEQRHLPFGALRATATNGLDTDRTYTGQIADESTGLMFYNARYYLPSLRRFISADTIVPAPANPENWNRYSYVGNSPMGHADPSGHETCDVVGGRIVRCYDDYEEYQTLSALTAEDQDRHREIRDEQDALVSELADAGISYQYNTGEFTYDDGTNVHDRHLTLLDPLREETSGGASAIAGAFEALEVEAGSLSPPGHQFNRQWGTLVAGAVNATYGGFKTVVGVTSVVGGAALLGTPFAPLGAAGIAYGSYQTGTGLLRTRRGLGQLFDFATEPCVASCDLDGQAEDAVRGLLPGESWMDRIGGLP